MASRDFGPRFPELLAQLALSAAPDGGLLDGFLALDDLSGGALGFRRRRAEELGALGRAFELREALPSPSDCAAALSEAESEQARAAALAASVDALRQSLLAKIAAARKAQTQRRWPEKLAFWTPSPAAELPKLLSELAACEARGGAAEALVSAARIAASSLAQSHAQSMEVARIAGISWPWIEGGDACLQEALDAPWGDALPLLAAAGMSFSSLAEEILSERAEIA